MKVARTVLRALGGKVPGNPVTRPHLTLFIASDNIISKLIL